MKANILSRKEIIELFEQILDDKQLMSKFYLFAK